MEKKLKEDNNENKKNGLDDSNNDLEQKSSDAFFWSSIKNTVRLDLSKTYTNLLKLIVEKLRPSKSLYLNFDYETSKMLLQQARENAIFPNENIELVFISKLCDQKTQKKLLLDNGYDKVRKTYKITDPTLYYMVCNALNGELDIIKCREFRKMFIDRFFNSNCIKNGSLESILDTLAFNVRYFYNPNNNFHERTSIEKSRTYCLDLIANYFFDDYYENVLIDINEVLKYVHSTNNKKIKKDHLDFYKEFVVLHNLELDEQIEFFNLHKHLEFVELFYDDIRLLKDESYKSLVDSCTVFDKDSSLYNQELSKKYGCDIYYLDGQEFYAFARVNMKIDKGMKMPSKEEVYRLSHSFCFIGKNAIMVFYNPNCKLTLLYGEINYKNIGHVCHGDSYTSSNSEFYSDRVNGLYTPKTLLGSTRYYDEIYISNFENIKPIALLCYDGITQWDIDFSKTYDLPIVIINTKKYHKEFIDYPSNVSSYIR